MKKTINMRMVAVFSFYVFWIVTITMFLIACLGTILAHFGFLNRDYHVITFFLSLGLISIVISTIFASFIGKKLLAPISKLEIALQEVSKGNFDIRLNEKSMAREIKNMEKNFNKMAQELGNTETFRNDFINNVSHEFRTPITAIEGYATLLQDEQLSISDQESYVQKILLNTRRLSSLTENILLISRLENHEIPLTKSPFQLDEQIRQTFLLFENEWMEKNLDLDISLEPVIYNGSCELLAQVWQNIIGNAVKFTPENGHISASIELVGSEVIVTIKDTGIGMSELTRKRIFEKFYQGDTSHSSRGNGLGMTLVKRILDLSDGKIDIISAPEMGTTFIVHLPA